MLGPRNSDESGRRTTEQCWRPRPSHMHCMSRRHCEWEATKLSPRLLAPSNAIEPTRVTIGTPPMTHHASLKRKEESDSERGRGNGEEERKRESLGERETGRKQIGTSFQISAIYHAFSGRFKYLIKYYNCPFTS